MRQSSWRASTLHAERHLQLCVPVQTNTFNQTITHNHRHCKIEDGIEAHCNLHGEQLKKMSGSVLEYSSFESSVSESSFPPRY
jgi:hypothetical protein